MLFIVLLLWGSFPCFAGTWGLFCCHQDVLPVVTLLRTNRVVIFNQVFVLLMLKMHRLQPRVMAATCKFENRFLLMVYTITCTAVDILFGILKKRFQVLWPPGPNGEHARGVFPLVLSLCTCALQIFECIPTSGFNLGPKVWTKLQRANHRQRRAGIISALTGPTPRICLKPYCDLLCFYFQLAIRSRDAGVR